MHLQCPARLNDHPAVTRWVLECDWPSTSDARHEDAPTATPGLAFWGASFGAARRCCRSSPVDRFEDVFAQDLIVAAHSEDGGPAAVESHDPGAKRAVDRPRHHPTVLCDLDRSGIAARHAVGHTSDPLPVAGPIPAMVRSRDLVWIELGWVEAQVAGPAAYTFEGRTPAPGTPRSGQRIRAAVSRRARHHRPMPESHTSALTPRLELRRPTEQDRPRFVELFCDDAFMVFSGGSLAAERAQARFDRMLARCAELSFAKQPIVERSSGIVIGYTGVDWIEVDGGRWLEWGYRLVPAARGQGLRHRSGPRPPRRGPQRSRRGTPRDHPPRQLGLPERDPQARVRLLEAGAGGTRPSQPLPTPGLTCAAEPAIWDRVRRGRSTRPHRLELGAGALARRDHDGARGPHVCGSGLQVIDRPLADLPHGHDLGQGVVGRGAADDWHGEAVAPDDVGAGDCRRLPA